MCRYRLGGCLRTGHNRLSLHPALFKRAVWGDGLPRVQLLPLQDMTSVALQLLFFWRIQKWSWVIDLEMHWKSFFLYVWRSEISLRYHLDRQAPFYIYLEVSLKSGGYPPFLSSRHGWLRIGQQPSHDARGSPMTGQNPTNSHEIPTKYSIVLTSFD